MNDLDIEKTVDLLFNFDEEEFKKEINYIERVKREKEKIEKITTKMLSSDTILEGEYFIIHGDLIYDLINIVKDNKEL